EHYQRIRRTGDWVFGIGGVVTYKKGGVAEVVAPMELADLVVETDAPYLPPVPYHGKRNEPSYVIHTAHRIAEVLGVPIAEVAHHTRENARRIFGI
ncbi:MAG: TatD family hydrolase, partial [Rikenellaceae bacterium]|nr:TatD family hydrolase [Rikenellaceae bacterium]